MENVNLIFEIYLPFNSHNQERRRLQSQIDESRKKQKDLEDSEEIKAKHLQERVASYGIE